MTNYFDNSASTRPYKEVLDEFIFLSSNIYSNPGSTHLGGYEAEKYIKEASTSLAKDLGCQADELIYTSGASESINQAIKGVLALCTGKPCTVVTLKTEHQATLNTLEYLASKNPNLKIVYWPQLEDGSFDPEKASEVLDDQVRLITMSSVNNVVGFFQDLRLLNLLRQEFSKNALIHIDHVQAWGKIKIELNKSEIDLASFSGHKIHAMKGTGLLYIKKNTKVASLIHGGDQQKKLRAGTPNMPGNVSMARASRINETNLKENYQKVSSLRDYFLEKLALTSLTYVVHSTKYSLPYIVNLSFPPIMGETIVNSLSQHDIYVGTQAACSKGNHTNYVLDALGKSTEESKSALRISLDHEHNYEDIDNLVEKLEKVIKELIFK